MFNSKSPTLQQQINHINSTLNGSGGGYIFNLPLARTPGLIDTVYKLEKEINKLKAILNEVVDHVYKENNE